LAKPIPVKISGNTSFRHARRRGHGANRAELM
jgi:hypothetical protein